MKTNRTLSLLLFSSVILLVVAGCKKTSSSSGAGVSASVNGSAWAATYPVSGYYMSGGGQFEIGGVQVKGGDTSGLALVFFSPIVVNQAVSSDSSQIDVGYIDRKSQTEYDGGTTAGHSIITVTSYDSAGHKIAGSFTGVLYNVANANDSLVITGGKFSTTFLSQ